MYARVLECTLQTEKRTDFNNILRDRVLPILKNEAGFVDLISFVSEEHPDHALGIALWKTKGDADHFYIRQEPGLDSLKPLLTQPPRVEHYSVETSIFQYAAASKAA
jgi:hypothetical protein